MSEIFNDLQEAPGIGFPVRLQIKPRRLLVSVFIVTVAIGTPAATAHKIRTPVAGREKVYSSPGSELTALLGGSEHQAQGLRESITALLANPLIPEQAGGNQLRVTYEDGKLTIIAENSCYRMFCRQCGHKRVRISNFHQALPASAFGHGLAPDRLALFLPHYWTQPILTTLSGPLRPIRKASKAYY